MSPRRLNLQYPIVLTIYPLDIRGSDLPAALIYLIEMPHVNSCGVQR